MTKTELKKYVQLWKYATITGGLIFFYSIIMIVGFNDLAYSVHSQLFEITKSQFNFAVYILMGFMKIIWVFFNIIPYIAFKLALKSKQ